VSARLADRLLWCCQVAIRITPTSFTQNSFQFGRQFDEKDMLVSKITRESIDLLKEFHKEDMKKEDWLLVIALKKVRPMCY
jgi:translation initiation factor 5B